MDPIAAEIVAGVLWFFIGNLGVVITFWAVFGLSALLAAATDQGWIAAVGVVLAWLSGLGVLAVVWINIIIHGVELVRLLTGGA